MAQNKANLLLKPGWVHTFIQNCWFTL
jgi:hypothetical protein